MRGGSRSNATKNAATSGLYRNSSVPPRTYSGRAYSQLSPAVVKTGKTLCRSVLTTSVRAQQAKKASDQMTSAIVGRFEQKGRAGVVAMIVTLNSRGRKRRFFLSDIKDRGFRPRLLRRSCDAVTLR